MRHGPGAVIALTLLLQGTAHAQAEPAATAPATVSVTATVTGLRSARGQVLACLTTREASFPDCAKDPAARRLKVAAAATVTLDFGQVPPGRYALSLFHDENGNGRLDKRLMLPREGYGFSRDAAVVMGPPRFSAAAFVPEGHSHQAIRMRYIL